MGFVVIILFLAGMIWFLRKGNRKSEDAMHATFCHCDMGDKIREMAEDPTTTWEEWRSMLPVAQWADDWWARTHPGVPNSSLTKEVVTYMEMCY